MLVKCWIFCISLEIADIREKVLEWMCLGLTLPGSSVSTLNFFFHFPSANKMFWCSALETEHGLC